MQLKTIEGEQVNLNAYDNKEDIQLFLKQKKYLTILLIKDILKMKELSKIIDY